MTRVLAALLLTLSGGCSYLGYHKRERAERVPSAEGERVEFPDSFEGAIDMKGPLVAALEIAMNEFLPPGAKVEARGGSEVIANCLSRRSTYDVLAMAYGDGLFYVSFSPRVERCGLADEILDGGAEYIVDSRGRVVRRR
ncbi:hypothetical protein FJV41_42160 [Myxococcus llanfairpwllgwyngyllgogerychwyrndrobwllllantysiliogogogochensis]|uniref:Lipoprotein n=1 Tax=Myxococcus llanfairpwllgwyngyllgogerychwyrndrobwllllantysiliogogogochensis TaxID=2590453 RepID=A0A540WLN4_9BACT|nr:hypothetical protein [Myxococcus llanfairpwllgwyngyllgogerychwyrndrobwllllantysiliogogogochensis]TQF09919.1 hypothetical protein FJV41_42160 [Myxococcus llanfairpwllgwyngyllgogerychwyrndrobwllllantysiliogogogochensis]